MNILMLSHGKYNEGILDSHNMIVGENEKIHTLSLTDSVLDFREQLDKLVGELLSQGELLVLCDLKGGTPYNQILEKKYEYPENIHIISGMNLPMVIELSLMFEQEKDIQTLIHSAVGAGKDGIERVEILEDEDTDDLDF